ncbi:hypothetical protein C8P68_102852 [Mucilaginibacter yixingensis]|uniref:Uncharacterized protein n=1 Tax=Mucilaginibacter yixingensis TaxID=1295612 RepID=A0A2T5JE24_9SPHI|nr:hypothetical protein [Mucilaginibacter yixingensis]PTR00021.1 hypothetical protein C8P68_102852 [Mucilaginibacter yixingensis]
MKYFLRRLKTSPTLFLIAGPLLILFFCYKGYFLIHLVFKHNIWGLMYPAYIAIVLLAMLLDGFLVKRMHYNWVTLIEIGLIVLFRIANRYEERGLTLNLYQMSGKVLVIIDDPKGLTPKDFKQTGIFNKEYAIPADGVLRINRRAFPPDEFNFKTPSDWQGCTEIFYSKPDYPFNWEMVTPAFSNVNYNRHAADSVLQSKGLLK